MSTTPKERTFPTRESYFTYCGWPESNPFVVGGAGANADQSEQSHEEPNEDLDEDPIW